MIRLFIQVNSCEFVKPVTRFNPLILPSSVTLLFSCAHHINSCAFWVVKLPCQTASIIPCGYLVIVPQARFLPLERRAFRIYNILEECSRIYKKIADNENNKPMVRMKASKNMVNAQYNILNLLRKGPASTEYCEFI